MLARREIWRYSDDGQVWVGKYRNSHNLLHWHPDCELICLEKGGIDVFCNGKSYSLDVGQSLFIDSEQMHYMRAVRPDTVLSVIIFDYEIIRFFAGNYMLACPVLQNDYAVSDVYRRLRAVLLQKQPFYGAEAACIVEKLMIDIFRAEKAVPKPPDAGKYTLAFKQLLEEINTNYRDITFEDAAEFMNMSPSYFSRFFHEAAGCTFSRQLNCVRTDEAIRLLQTKKELTVTEVAYACGFGTIRNFNRIFKELTGYSPRELPEGFKLDYKFSYPSDRAFNPSLYDCELIESSANESER